MPLPIASNCHCLTQFVYPVNGDGGRLMSNERSMWEQVFSVASVGNVEEQADELNSVGSLET
jgi:hypothetical protein